MGTFDEAKKLFPPPKPDHGPDKPKEKPQPLGLGRAMQFNGVVGRSSLPIATTLTNPNHKPVAFDVRTSGLDFRATSTSGEIGEVQKGDNTMDVSVEYAPTKPGTTHGILQILSRFEDDSGERGPAIEQELELVGLATRLEHTMPAPADGSPRPIPDQSIESKQLAPRQQIENDLDTLSGLAETYTKIVRANDFAAGEMIERIYNTKLAFDHEIQGWVQAELAANTISEASATKKLAWKAFGKLFGAGIEQLELGSVVGFVVGHVADMALDRLEEYIGKDPQAKSKTTAGLAATEGASALIAEADEVVRRRMGGLNARLVKSREEAAQLAGMAAMQREEGAQDALASNKPYKHASTTRLVDDFRAALERYSNTCRAIAATATQLQPSLVASFNSLRMSYLSTRASKATDLTYRVDYAIAWDLGSEGTHGREVFRVFEPKISGVDRLSEPMRNFIAHRKLSDYAADARVSVRVNCNQGGYVIIEKSPGGEPEFKQVEGVAAVRAFMRGAKGFWALLEQQVG